MLALNTKPSGHSIISGVSACFTSSDPDAFTHICLSLGECYFNRLFS